MVIAIGIIAILLLFLIISVVSKKYVKTAEDYWLMGRRAKWWMFAGTLSASYVSLATFIGGVGTAWSWGPMPYLLFFTSSITFGWIIAVVLIGLRMRKMGSTSISDFYKQRFGSESKALFSGISLALIGILFFYLLVQMQGGGIVIATIFDLPLYVGVAIMVAIVGITLAFSGMYSVVLTDTLSMFIFVLAAVVILPGTILVVGGLDSGIAAISAQEAWSATGLSGLDMTYFVGYALAWLSIIGGSPHLINRSLIVENSKSVVKGSFVAYILTITVTIVVFISSAMLMGVIEPGSIDPDTVSPFAAMNVWPWYVGVVVISAAMGAAFTTANTQTLTVSQGIVDIFRFSLMRNISDNQLKKLTTVFSVVVLVVVGLFATQKLWLIVIASSLAGVIASLGFFPTLILSLYWKRLTLKATNIMMWLSVPVGTFMIAANHFWGWFAPFPTIYSYPIGFGGLIVLSLLTKQTAAEIKGYEMMKEQAFSETEDTAERSDYLTIFIGLAVVVAVFVLLLKLLGLL